MVQKERKKKKTSEEEDDFHLKITEKNLKDNERKNKQRITCKMDNDK